MSSSSLTADIQQEEEDIFAQLSCYDYEKLLNHPQPVNFARKKALSQLAVSTDSPFSREPEHEKLGKLKGEQVSILRDETYEIKRQLDAVKSRLSELRQQQTPSEQNARSNERVSGSISQQVSFSLPPIRKNSNQTQNLSSKEQPQPKYRPLTGKTDCPDCACDRKRNSICSQCLSLTQPQAKRQFLPASNLRLLRQPSLINQRRFEPAVANKDSGLVTKNESVVADDKIVPNQVYTISKSLNEKRTKLAQAIDDLQLMIEQLKEKGNKLEQERKLVQLYKDQWKYGPSIGGPKASSRERLGGIAQQRRTYESRLDPNLLRDSKSVQGFRHIEPGLKLRQYESPKIRRPNEVKQTFQQRSKSLDSLKQFEKLENDKQRNFDNKFQEGKSASEVDLPNKLPGSTNEEDIDKSDSLSPQGSVVDCRDSPERESKKTESQPARDAISNEKETMQRMTWIPVFGETEIKTIKRTPKRKVQIVSPDHGRSRTCLNYNQKEVTSQNTTTTLSPSQRRSALAGSRKPIANNTVINKSKSNNRILSFATKKLNAAAELMDQEKHDSSTKNQLVINKQQIFDAATNGKKQTKNTTNEKDLEEESRKDVMKEIARLEELVNEQQRLLTRINQDQHRMISPIAVSCSSPCCHSVPQTKTSNRIPLGNRSLINNLRDRLSKTKTRLARTLESERERHQQLELQVNSSLRKQSDLENENELLKQSLGKCIDTCLKDISNTFESLSNTLTDSIAEKHPEEDEVNQSTSSTLDNDTLFTSAAQLISDNKHLKQMKSHIESIEQQRKVIFEELSREKQKSNNLETQLKQSQAELDQLHKIKQSLDSQGNHSNVTTDNYDLPLPVSDSTNSLPASNHINECQPSTSNLSTSETSTFNDSYNSVDLYNRYIKSMSPDIESIRQERKLLLTELDNIKNKLFDMNSVE